MLIREYITQFERSSHFAHHMVDTPKMKARKFTQGLIPSIRHLFLGHLSKPFETIVGLARDLEEDNRQNQKQFKVIPLPRKSFEQIPPTYYQENKQTWDGERKSQPAFPYNQ